MKKNVTTRLRSKGQITLPGEVREVLGVEEWG